MNAWTVVVTSRRFEEQTVYVSDRQQEATRAAKLIAKGSIPVLRALVRPQEIEEAEMKRRWAEMGQVDGEEGAPCPCVARTWRNVYWNAYRTAESARQRQGIDCDGK